jgi:hypothetical protein
MEQSPMTDAKGQGPQSVKPDHVILDQIIKMHAEANKADADQADLDGWCGITWFYSSWIIGHIRNSIEWNARNRIGHRGMAMENLREQLASMIWDKCRMTLDNGGQSLDLEAVADECIRLAEWNRRKSMIDSFHGVDATIDEGYAPTTPLELPPKDWLDK